MDASAFLPTPPTLDRLARAAIRCTACPLYRHATQTVFGEGEPGARLMLVGEQPGDIEDHIGRPFVGPAGRLLDRALGLAGIDRDDAYLTNAVKHLKWTPRGKRRIHGKPNAGEIRACRPWLIAEIAAVKPEVIVCLGATAAQALLGSDFRVSRQRGEWIDSDLAPRVIATVHPSSLLRIRGAEEREAALQAFVADLAMAAGDEG
jgi:uracil-DNA glycosylase